MIRRFTFGGTTLGSVRLRIAGGSGFSNSSTSRFLSTGTEPAAVTRRTRSPPRPFWPTPGFQSLLLTMSTLPPVVHVLERRLQPVGQVLRRVIQRYQEIGIGHVLDRLHCRKLQGGLERGLRRRASLGCDGFHGLGHVMCSTVSA